MTLPAWAQTAFPGAAQRDKLQVLVRDQARVGPMWETVRRQADDVLNDAPQPLRHIVYEGRLDTDPQRVATVRSLRDMGKLDLLTQADAVTGDARYAEKQREFVLAWATTYEPTGNPINENKLIPVLVSYALQRDAFASADRPRVDAWVRALAAAGIESARARPDSTGNNWHPKRLELVAAAAWILGEDHFTRYAVEGAQSYVASSLRPDGSSFDFEHRDALSYHMGGVAPLLRLAALLKPSGFDLYHYEAPNGAGVKKSVAFVAPYARAEKTHGEFARTKGKLDQERAAAGLEHYRPGRLFDPKSSLQFFEMATAFEPGYGALVARLAGAPGEQHPTWNVVLARAGWLHGPPKP